MLNRNLQPAAMGEKGRVNQLMYGRRQGASCRPSAGAHADYE